MLPDQVSNPGPLTYESGALPIALRGPAGEYVYNIYVLKTVLRFNNPFNRLSFFNFPIYCKERSSKL